MAEERELPAGNNDNTECGGEQTETENSLPEKNGETADTLPVSSPENTSAAEHTKNTAEAPSGGSDGENAGEDAATEGGVQEDAADLDIPISAYDLEDEIEHKHTNNKKKSRKKTWTLILFLVVNVVVIAVTAAFEFGGEHHEENNIGSIISSIGSHWYYLVCAFACFLCVYLFQALKMSTMVRAMTGQRKFRACLNTVILGKYYDNITPLAVGGQPFQAYYLTKSKVPAGTATAAPLVSWMLGSMSFLTLCILSFIFFKDSVDSALIRICAYIGVALNFATPMLILSFSFMPRVTTKVVSFAIRLLHKLHLVKNCDETIAKAIHTVNDYKASIGFMWRSKWTLVFGYLLSLIEKLAEMSITYFVMMACFNGSTDGYLVMTATTLFISAATCFVPTPGTAGASEGSFYIVFQSFYPMFIWRIFSYYMFLFFGFATIVKNSVRRSRRERKNRKAA